MSAIACTFGAGGVHAQAGQLGAYTGTIEVTGTQISPKVSYRASVKVNLPVSSRTVDAITAEFLAGEAPDATVTISQWDISHTDKFADSGGQFNSDTCALAAPVEIPMSATGVLGAHFEKPLPFTDSARLTAKYTLMPTSSTKGQYGPIAQEWVLQLTR